MAEVPLNETTVAPVKLVPVIVTAVPLVPLAGEKLEIVGAAVTEKLPAEVAVPSGVVTEIFPLVAPLGTVLVICAALTVWMGAAVPLKESCVAPVKFVPVTVTAVPIAPLLGEKPVILGDCVAGVTGVLGAFDPVVAQPASQRTSPSAAPVAAVFIGPKRIALGARVSPTRLVSARSVIAMTVLYSGFHYPGVGTVVAWPSRHSARAAPTLSLA